MGRPLRLEFDGALYHVTSRGDRREDIYLSDEDRRDWLEVLATTCKRFNWVVHSYCLMSNHYHLMVQTIEGNLSNGMRQLNGHYTRKFNQRYGLVGHLFQGRFKAILVQKENYLLELSRYIVLNPVRAKMVQTPEQWPWSSFRCTAGNDIKPAWLDTDWLLSQFGSNRSQAISAYESFVLAGVGLPSPLQKVRHQLLLGDDEFVQRYQESKPNEKLSELSMSHRRALVKTLNQYKASCESKEEAMAQAYRSGAYTMGQIAQHFEVHYMTVSRAVRKVESQAVELESISAC